MIEGVFWGFGIKVWSISWAEQKISTYSHIAVYIAFFLDISIFFRAPNKSARSTTTACGSSYTSPWGDSLESEWLATDSKSIKQRIALSATFLRHLKEDCAVDPFYPATPWTDNEPFFLLSLVIGTLHPTPGTFRCDSREEQGCNKVKRHGYLSSHAEGSCAFEPSWI